MPNLVRPVGDVPGGPDVTVVEETRTPNAEQLAAIDAPGLVFVSAGAGTGKTTVLVERFVRAVCDRGLSIDSVLAITYTERAAGELRGRIRSRLAELDRHDLARELDGAWISTIHGFCHRLLKAHPFEAAVDPNFRVLDENQARVLASEAFDLALEEFCASARSGADPAAGHVQRAGAAPDADPRLRDASLGRSGARARGGRAAGASTIGSRSCARRRAPRDDGRRGQGRQGTRERRPRARAARASTRLRAAPRSVRRSRAAAPASCSPRYEAARGAVEQAALDELAARDRALLEELLRRFADAYAAAKASESALDFEDLQLAARDLLRDEPAIRERESWRFRSVLVDEFQDTNRLQCELIDLLRHRGPVLRRRRVPVDLPASGTRTWRSSASGVRPPAACWR